MNTKKIFRLTKTLTIVESLVEESEEVDENDGSQGTTLKTTFDQIRNAGERYSNRNRRKQAFEFQDESRSIQVSEDSESTVGSKNQSHGSTSNVSIAKVTSAPQRDLTKPNKDSPRLSIILNGNNSPNSSKKPLPNSSKKGSTLKGKRAKLNETCEVIQASTSSVNGNSTTNLLGDMKQSIPGVTLCCIPLLKLDERIVEKAATQASLAEQEILEREEKLKTKLNFEEMNFPYGVQKVNHKHNSNETDDYQHLYNKSGDKGVIDKLKGARELTLNKETIEWKPSLFCGDKVQTAIIEKEVGLLTSHGLLKIAGTAEKPSEETGDYVTHITILHGVCQVYIGEKYGVVKSTDIFTVPPKTIYSVQNLRKDEAELMFIKKK